MIRAVPPAMHPEKFGRYEVQGLLGEGSMGRVYRAFDPLGHRVVALKTVRPEFLGGETAEEYLRRFRREAQAAGALSHPSIITIFDVGSDYFVMELLEGATLQALLRERGRLPLAEALRILGPVGEALDYAHASGVIHRDIKPANLMLLPDGRTKIMDFGVAHQAARSMSVSSQFLGSPSYMAPERILRGQATPRSDLFSFAVVAYECLAGAKPFPGGHVSEVVARVVKEQAAPPSSLNPDLPPDYDAVFRTALAKDPAERFPTARAFMVALGWEGDTASAPLALPAASAGAAAAASEPGTLVDAPPIPVETGRRSAGLRLALGAVALVGAFLLAGYLRRPASNQPTLSLPLPVPGSPVLSIDTTPAGAQVILDGREAGVSPLVLDGLPLGLHTLKVTHAGYVPTQLNVELRPGTGHVPLALPLLPLDVHAEGPAPTRQSVAVSAPTPLPAASATAAVPAVPDPVDTAERPVPAPSHAVLPAPAAPPGPTSEPRRISGAKPRYPDLARPLRQRGTVIVEMVVGETGEPRDLRILESAGPILDAAALDAVLAWRYEPAQKDGVKVAALIRVQLDFEPPQQ